MPCAESIGSPARRFAPRGLWLLVLLLATLGAIAPPVARATGDANGAVELVVYVREGCPHCAAAKDYLDRFAAEQPGLSLRYRWVDRDPQAAEELTRIAQETGQWPPGVPTFVANRRVLVGFESAERSGPLIAALLHTTGADASPTPIATRLFGELSPERLGLPAFTLALGLLDGFNPCAMWVLLFLLSMLVRLNDRRRMALIAGCFVLVGGAVYYAFMAAWLNVFLLVGLSASVRVGLALLALAIAAVNLKDFALGLRGPSLSIPASAKPGLYARMRAVLCADSLALALLAAGALAVVVNFIELLCTAGFPAIYTAILSAQQLDPAAHYAYLGLYILGYIADDALMVGTAVAALGSRRLGERGGRWLKGLSGVVMLGLGLVMLLRPEWLD